MKQNSTAGSPWFWMGHARTIDFAAATDEIIEALTHISGVGQWTAQYVALRALGDPDAFPTSDLILRRMAGGVEGALSEAEMESRAEAWGPWRGYAATYLWDAAASSPPQSTGSSAPLHRIHESPELGVVADAVQVGIERC